MGQKAQVILDYDYYKDLLEFEKAVKENTIICFPISDFYGFNFSYISQINKDEYVEKITKLYKNLEDENNMLKAELMEKSRKKSFFKRIF